MDTVGVCGHQKKKKSVGGAKEYMGMEVRIKNGTSSECCIYINFGLHLGGPGGAAAPPARGRHMGNSLTRRLLQR